jgi:hypothetical protein
MLDNNLRLGRNDASSSDAFAKHSFPPGGLVAQARTAYESTPLLPAQIRFGVFVFADVGGNRTVIAGSPRGTIVDTGYGPPMAEFDSVWGRGYVTGAHFTRMALAGMGLINARAALQARAA